ncbi:MAG: MFS transporter [Gammaproteobacteria bacterium]|nr:MFS transporter [Gammaproteobacteria bacterium]
MTRDQINFLFLNVGHFLDHLFLLIFATVAALSLTAAWDMTYAELIPYATPGFVVFGLCAVPAGWLADKWSREGMMIVFFIGIGLASIATAFTTGPWTLMLGLTAIGVFGAIYHPVGISMVVQGRKKTGVPLAINGIFGNLGVASAALLTGLLIDSSGWRSAFVLPGIVSVAVGVLYWRFVSAGRSADASLAATAVNPAPAAAAAAAPAINRATLVRVFAIIFFTTAIGGLIFQSTTFALPKVFDERLADLAGSASAVGMYAFMVFAVAAFAQLVVGHLVDNYPVRVVFSAVAFLQAVFLGLMIQLQGIAALLVAVAFMLVVFGQIPINDVLIGRLARSEWRSRAFAARYIVTFTVTATVIPGIAWLHSSWGFGVLFAVLSAAALLIFTATMMLPSANAVVDGRAPEAA